LLVPFQAFAQDGAGSYFDYPAVVLYRSTCVSDTSNATTYTFNAISNSIPDSDGGKPYIGILGEDGLAAFSISSATIEGVSASELVDEDGTGIVNSGFYALDVKRSGLSSVDVTVTFSEAITGAVVCLWVADYSNPGDNDNAGAIDDDTASGSMPLTLSPTTPTPGGAILGVCASSGTADSTTWGVAGEREDTQNAEFDYSSADLTSTGTGSNSVTCDWAGNTLDSTGAAIQIPTMRGPN
jgi:hypothetical protein